MESLREELVQNAQLLRAVQEELRRHSLGHFSIEEEGPEGGHGTVVILPGCPECRKVLHTHKDFVDHLIDDVLPGLFGPVRGNAAERLG
jgi:hypothetical protein